MWVGSLGQEDPLEEGMSTHSGILAWRIPWSPWGRKKSDATEQLSHVSKLKRGNVNLCMWERGREAISMLVIDF